MISWFEQRPGGIVHQSLEDPTMLLVSPDPPEYLKLPEDLGGEARRVLEAGLGWCVKNGHRHQAYHYRLEGDIHCCECLPDEVFYWYRKHYEESN